MTLEDASLESRIRLTETLSLWTFIKSAEPKDLSATSEHLKAIKGLWLVGLYGVLEKALNQIVQLTIETVSASATPRKSCRAEVHSIFLYAMVDSVRNCAGERVFERAAELFSASRSNVVVTSNENPLAAYLQNVDGSTIVSICKYFGAPVYTIDRARIGRLNNLKERRNAVAHGRESPAEVGERFPASELKTMYDIVDEEVLRLLQHVRNYCDDKLYLDASAA